jgi:hypothetical protein
LACPIVQTPSPGQFLRLESGAEIMRRRTRHNIPVFIALAAVVLIILVIALGSLGGGGKPTAVASPTAALGPTAAVSASAINTVEIPPSLWEMPVPPETGATVIGDSSTGLMCVDRDVSVEFCAGVTVYLATILISSNEINTFLASELGDVSWTDDIPQVDGESNPEQQQASQTLEEDFTEPPRILVHEGVVRALFVKGEVRALPLWIWTRRRHTFFDCTVTKCRLLTSSGNSTRWLQDQRRG